MKRRKLVWTGLVAISISTGTIIWVMGMYDDPYAKVSIGVLLAILIPSLVIKFRQTKKSKAENPNKVSRIVVATFLIFLISQLFLRPDVVDAVSVFIWAIPVAIAAVVIYDKSRSRSRA